MLIVFSMLISFFSNCVASESFDPDQLIDLWASQKETLKDRRPGTIALDSKLYPIWELLMNQGVSRSSWLAMGYTIEGRSLLALDQKQEAMWAFRSALDFDRGYIPAVRVMLLSSYKTGFGSFLSAMKAYLSVLFISKDMWGWLLTIGNLALVLSSSILVFFVLFSICTTIRFFSLLMHDLTERYSEIPNKLVLRGIIIVFCMLPLLLGMGLFWTALWLIAISQGYLHQKELKFIWFLIVLLVMIIPLHLVRVAILQAVEDGYLAAVVYAQDAGYSSNAIEKLESNRRLNPDNSRSRFIAGTLYKRGANYFEALREYLEYTRMNDSDPNGHVNLGNIYFILNNLNEAIAEYRKAENLNPENAAIYFNLSKAYLHQFKFQQATEMLKKASEIDPQLVSANTELPTVTPNRMLIDMSIPNAWIYSEFSRYWTIALIDTAQYWQKPGLWLSLEGYLVTIAGFVLLLLMQIMFKSKFNRSHFCTMCAQPTCRICAKDNDSKHYCAHCQLVFLKKGQLDAKERESKMKEISCRTDLKRRYALTFAVAVPGAGDLYLGRLWRGFSMSMLWIMCVFFLLYSNQRMLVPPAFLSIGDYIQVIFWIVLMMIIYSISIFFMIREKRD